MPIAADVQGFSPPPEAELFELSDFDIFQTNEVLRFCNLGTVSWRGKEYVGIPCDGTGFVSAGQSFPRPQLTVGNVSITGQPNGLLLSSLIAQYNNLNGATIKRIVTLEKYLDGMPNANPLEQITSDTWQIEQKLEDTDEYIKWELSYLGLENTKVPRRKMYRNYCSSIYRGGICGYTGVAVAKIDNTLTNDINQDRCAHDQTACFLRFPIGTVRFAGVPGLKNY
jgi:lambda family phage minor tail protein L